MQVELRNEGPGELWMVGVVDGSEEGVRLPRYRPSIARGGEVVAAPGAAEDPLAGPLRSADFRRLGPGESFDPTRGEHGAAFLPLATFSNFVPSTPGAYRYSLELSTDGAPERWLGRFGADQEREAVLGLVELVPRLSVRSNELVIDVR